MGRTRRSRKKQQKAQKRLEREVTARQKAGRPINALVVGRDTKTRKAPMHLGEELSADRLRRLAALFEFRRAKVKPSERGDQERRAKPF